MNNLIHQFHDLLKLARLLDATLFIQSAEPYFKKLVC